MRSEIERIQQGLSGPIASIRTSFRSLEDESMERLADFLDRLKREEDGGAR